MATSNKTEGTEHKPTANRDDMPAGKSKQDQDGKGASRDTGPNNAPTDPAKGRDKK